jgi:hypothetical protein
LEARASPSFSLDVKYNNNHLEHEKDKEMFVNNRQEEAAKEQTECFIPMFFATPVEIYNVSTISSV